jgi:DNA transposition AAA+ family ATPase
MKNKLAPVKNVAALSAAFEALDSRSAGVPGMGLVYGDTGAGKTTAVTWLLNRTRGVYVRATATWTPSAMLGAIMTELNSEPLNRGGAAMVDHIRTRLAEQQRPLFVDEADYLLHNLKMLETLRDIHDLSSSPVVLVGMAGIERKLSNRQQLSGRISQWVEFKPADLEDAATLAKHVCEVEIAPDLLSDLHTQAKGSVRLMIVGLARIEALAKTQDWGRVDSDLWANRKLFLSTGPGR